MTRIHQDVTDRILAELKNGVRPWVKPWSQTPGLNIPANAVTGRPYGGINKILLWVSREAGQQPRYLTFKQAKAAGGYVRQGEHGHAIVFVKDVVKKEDVNTDDPSTYRMLKTFTVFNIAQCDGLPDTITAVPQPPNRDQRDKLLEEFVGLTGACVKERDPGSDACYAISLDQIFMPQFQSFKSGTDYYAVLFHELIHWTRHPSRLDRRLDARFKAQTLAAEELIAEIGAAFLCAEFSIDGVVPQTAAYIESYLCLLEDDPRAIFTAAAKAQEAIDFLRQRLLANSALEVAAIRTDGGVALMAQKAQL